jgi:hypothetical protein
VVLSVKVMVNVRVQSPAGWLDGIVSTSWMPARSASRSSAGSLLSPQPLTRAEATLAPVISPVT